MLRHYKCYTTYTVDLLSIYLREEHKFLKVVLFSSIANLYLFFDSELFITFLVGLFLEEVGRNRIFLFGRFIACINTYLHAKFKSNLSEMCKIDKPPSLSIKTLKDMIPGKDGKWNLFFFSNLKCLQLI